MTATEVVYRMELFWESKRLDLLRIDYDILTAGFNVVLPFARATLLWARVRSRWGSKHAAKSDCSSCGEECPVNECPESKRPCGHHCNHSWSHDLCCWCGQGFSCEDGRDQK